MSDFYNRSNKTKVSVNLMKLIDNHELKEQIDSEDVDIDIFLTYLVNGLTSQSSKYADDPFSSIPNNKQDVILEKICKKLDVPRGNFVPFNFYLSKKNEVSDGLKNFKKDNYFIIYRNESGLIKSLLMFIRNALAHGNIIKLKDAYVLYAYSLMEKNIINGCMKIKSTKQLKIIVSSLKVYNKSFE